MIPAHDVEAELWSTTEHGWKIGFKDAMYKTHFHVDDPDHGTDKHIKDMTILWAAATFIFLKTPVNATAATILVAAAAFGGAHAEGWPALPLQRQVTSPFAPAWSTHGT